MTEREVVEALPEAERAPYKAALIRDRAASLGLVKGTRLTRDGLTIEFDDAPRVIQNRAGVGTAIDAMVRVFDSRGRELQVDPHRICINPPILVPDGTFTLEKRALHGIEYEARVPNLVEDPEEAYLRWLVATITETPAAKGFRTRGTVTTFFASTDNGFIDSSSATYATARDGGGSFYVSSTDNPTMGYTTSAGQYFLDMAFVRFDTSSLGDTDTIDVVALAVYGTTSANLGGGELFEARTGYTWSGGGVTSADWRTGAQFEALTLCATLSLATWSDSGYNTFVESGTTFRSNVNKTGQTEITLCTAKHRTTGTAPSDLSYGTFINATASGTTQDPKLTVTHTAAAGGGSAALLRPNQAFYMWNRRG